MAVKALSIPEPVPSGDISGDIVEVGVGTVYRIGGDAGGRGAEVLPPSVSRILVLA